MAFNLCLVISIDFFCFNIKLERQVSEYKVKLDELRRAKATTVVKLEKEYVNTSIPGFALIVYLYCKRSFLLSMHRLFIDSTGLKRQNYAKNVKNWKRCWTPKENQMHN